MNIDDVIREVETLQTRLQRARVLERAGPEVLSTALESLHVQKGRRKADWVLKIDREEPLQFRRTCAKRVKYDMAVDLACEISPPQEGIPCGKHGLVVRVWCFEKSVYFDPKLDSLELGEEIETGQGRRVMHRFRFDYACGDSPPKGEEPWFHLQIGGQQRSNEFFRMPDNLGVPRFHHYPMNLAMTCEFVVRHFYPEAYDALVDEPSFRCVLKAAQSTYLPPYLDRVKSYRVDSGDSFLSHLWHFY